MVSRKFILRYFFDVLDNFDVVSALQIYGRNFLRIWSFLWLRIWLRSVLGRQWDEVKEDFQLTYFASCSRRYYLLCCTNCWESHVQRSCFRFIGAVNSSTLHLCLWSSMRTTPTVPIHFYLSRNTRNNLLERHCTIYFVTICNDIAIYYRFE